MDSLSDLTEDQIARLSDELDRYLQALEAGEAVDPEDVAKRQPDIAEAFNIYLKKLDALYGIRSELPQGQDWSKISDTDTVLQLGDFRIEQEIGRGGMGIVYEAEQLSLQRKVALKILPMAALLDTRQIARFKNEAHSAGLLRHPHIVPIYSIGYENGLHYYAMQYIPGSRLINGFESNKPLHRRTIRLRMAGDASRGQCIPIGGGLSLGSSTSLRLFMRHTKRVSCIATLNLLI